MSAGPSWTLAFFLDRLDAWIDSEHPSDELRTAVTTWILTRFDTPYAGVRREPGIPNLWFGPIPGTDVGDGTVVTCSYWIYESSRTVSCNSFATLSLPI